MQEHRVEKTYSRLQVAYFATLLIAILLLSFLIFQPFVTVLVVSATFGIILNPVYTRILRKVRNKNAIAALLTIILLFILIITPLFFLGKQVFNEAHDTYITVATGYNTPGQGMDFVQQKIQSFFPNFTLDLQQYATEATQWFLSNLGSFFSGTLDIVLKSFLGVIALFYFLKDGPRFRRAYIELSPLPDEYDEKILKTLEVSVRSIISGSFLVAIIQGILCGIGFFMFGIQNPALWGMVAAISALVPGVGTSLVLIPAVLYLLFTSSLGNTLGLFLWGTLLVGLIDNFLSPKLIERGINIHPLFILFSVIGGLTFFGPAGFIMGPLVLSLLFTLFDIYDLFIHQEKIEEKKHE